MKRRRFLAASSLGGAIAAVSGAAGSPGASNPDKPQILEWIRFQVLNSYHRGPLNRFLEESVLPGLKRIGCGPIGVFQPKYGAHGGDICMLVPYPDVETWITAWDRLEEEPEYRKAADTALESPLYERMETSVMQAFSHMPAVEVPSAVSEKAERIFEFRTYEAPNRPKLSRKIEMFNEGGELNLFRETGLHPVFFGKTIAGRDMPNLTYMLAFESMEQRDAGWKRFVESPGWAAMKDLPRYRDTVSTITDTIYRPVGFSEI